MSKILYVVCFLLGFIVAGHWDGGVELVKEISPFTEKTIVMKVKKAVKQDMGSKMKRAYEDSKNAIKQQADKMK